MKSFILIMICIVFGLPATRAQLNVYSKDNGLTSNAIQTAFVDSRDIVWIGTSDGLNAIANSQVFPIKQIEDNESKKFNDLKAVNKIYEDRKGNLWFGTDKGLFMYNRKFWTNYEYAEEEDYIITNILEDRQGWMWFLHEKSHDMLSELGYTLATGTVQMFDRLYWYVFDIEASGSAHSRTRKLKNFYTAMLEDTRGNIWFSSLDGVKMCGNLQWTSYTYKDLGASKCYDLIEDKSGFIWVGTENGIARWKNGEWTLYSKKDGLPGDEVYDLQLLPDGEIWSFHRNESKFTGLGFYNGEQWICFDQSQIGLKGEVEKLIWLDSVIIAFSKHGISIFSEGEWQIQGSKQGVEDDSFQILEKDRHGQVWLAGDKSFYQYKSGEWVKLFTPDQSWTVTDLFFDKQGQIWLSTEKTGVFRFDQQNWMNYSTKEGLPDNHVSEIFEDKKGQIWFITKKGVASMLEDTVSTLH